VDEVSGLASVDALVGHVTARTSACRGFFAAEGERLARLSHSMAERFARDGRLIALGASPTTRSDARHIAVEFVHPVIVGKRALPALALTVEGGALDRQLALLAEPDDIVVGFDAEDAGCMQALALARSRGCLVVVLGAGEGPWTFSPATGDGFIDQEIAETLYHMLWEHVHVFLEHRGLLAGRTPRPLHDAGASSFLYPSLDESEDDLGALLADVRASIELKGEEVIALREQTLREGAEALTAGAGALRASFEAGGRLLLAGNGGSATDATDAAADFRAAARPGWRPRAALDLTDDAGILTAIANDVGVEAIFARQVIAHGRPGDALITCSTSGSSANVIAALAEARRRELVTIALVGYDGGRIAQEALADHVIITRSTSVPRIQEAQASAYHVLRELVELDAARRPPGGAAP
jgi:D-sedoheptulose 7-phosphate isomerase